MNQVLSNVRNEFPSQILIFGKLLANPSKIATKMNEFFVKKISDLKENSADNVNKDPMLELKTFLNSKNLPPRGFKLKEITEKETLDIFKSLKGKKSCGLDWICGFSIKIAAKELLPEITCLINLSIKSGLFYSK